MKNTSRFFIILFFLLPLFSHAQTVNTTSIENLFPYKVTFSEAQKRFLITLDQTIIQRLVDIAKMTMQQNLQAATTGITNSNLVNNPSNISNPTTVNPYLNQTNSAQTNPYLQSGQTSPTGGSPTQSGLTGLLSGYLNSQNQEPNAGPSQKAGESSEEGTQTGPSPRISMDDSDLNVTDIDSSCRSNYGVDVSGSCPNMVNTTSKLKQTAMEACTLVKKRLKSASAYRTPSCNSAVGGASNSSHTTGMAIDLSLSNLNSEEKVKVLRKFKQAGFDNLGCYGRNGAIHLDHRSGTRRWGASYGSGSFSYANCPPEVRLAGY